LERKFKIGESKISLFSLWQISIIDIFHLRKFRKKFYPNEHLIAIAVKKM